MERENRLEHGEGKKSFINTIEFVVFLPAFIIMIGCVVFGFWKQEVFLKGLIAIYNWATTNIGWTYAVITVFYLAVLLLLLIHPAGKIRLGGTDAKPELSGFTWFCITLTSTIGISLLMWGGVEPIVHFTNPPAFSGAAPLSEDAATFALSTGYIHWSFNQYALYTFAGVVVALAHFNHNQPLSVASGMYYAFGENGMKGAGKVVDALCLIVIIGGVATSLGIGITQLASGLFYAVGISPSTASKLIITIVLVVTYTAASVSGIKRGISHMSRINVWIFFALLAYTYLVGHTLFINELGLQSIGEFLHSGIRRTLMLGPVSDDPWPGNWTINFYIANAAYAPLMGVFLAKLGRGRTLRQFIGVNLGVCSVFNIVWFNIFGGAAIWQQIHGLDIAAVMTKEGLQSAAYAFFSTLPGAAIIIPLFVIATFFSFVTMAESLSTAMAAISMKGGLSANEEEPSTGLKVLWGVFVGALGYLLVGLVGVDVIKYTYMVFGFPIFIILGIMGYSLLKGLFFPSFNIVTAIKSMR
jgi:choline-glycine betaine transporter